MKPQFLASKCRSLFKAIFFRQRLNSSQQTVNDAPPREVPEDDLQVDKQFTDLHIQVADIKAQHEVEVIRKEARDDGCKVQMKYPKDDPAHPNAFMLR